MIKYISTRGNKKKYLFSEVVLKGIASDGGLFVPIIIPQIRRNELKELVNASYHERAIFVFKKFQLDFSENKIEQIVKNAYSSNFDASEIAPLVHLKKDEYLLELWHGPTSAFKDMALQIMPYFFSEAIKADNKKRLLKKLKPLHYLILVATSGDTGKAALEGYKDKENISIVVFYPDGHVSQLQELQMVTQEGSNVAVYTVKGDFDATQRLVKDIFNDKEFNSQLLNKFQTVLSSANSINWGRLLPQIVYYFDSYLQLINQNRIELGEEIDIAVPTGNFGNILAAFYAMKMGLPIRKFICASNTNNVLTKFLKTGVYDISKRKLVQTPSPSMDILVASNIERLLYVITNNHEKVSQWMNELKSNGKFEVDNVTKHIIQDKFYADWVSNEDCLQNIKEIYQEEKYLMDPHTSVAQMVADRYIQKKNVLIPVIICSTAHWAKFASDVHKYLVGLRGKLKSEFEILQDIQRYDQKLSIPSAIESLNKKNVRFREKLDADKKSVEENLLNHIQ